MAQRSNFPSRSERKFGLRKPGDQCRQNEAIHCNAEFLDTIRGVAQLVARLLWEQDAAGSNPVTPTKHSGFDRIESRKTALFCDFSVWRLTGYDATIG